MKAFNRMASLLCVFLVIFVLFSGVAAAGDSVSIQSTTGSIGTHELESPSTILPVGTVHDSPIKKYDFPVQT